MEAGIMFKNAGEPWLQEEDIQLNKLYNINKIDIIEISKIHNRAPGGIISRLQKHNYITNRVSARGYNDYKNSDLYKEIVSTNNNKKKTTQPATILISINKSDYIEIENEFNNLKNEIRDLKKNMNLKNTIKELIDMMKAVYDFED